MIEISGRSRWGRWYRLWAGDQYSPDTNLCQFFRRAVIFPGFIMFALGLLLFLVVLKIIEYPKVSAIVAAVCMFMFGLGVGIYYIIKKVRAAVRAARKQKEIQPPSLLAAWVRAKKLKVCPLIRIVEMEMDEGRQRR